MTQTAPSPTIEHLIPVARSMLWLADAATKDIPAEKFARMPPGVTANSPAFVIGHLATYPDRMMRMLGAAGTRDNEDFEALFRAGTECRDDPDGTIYPPKGEILARFRDRHAALMDTLPTVHDEALGGENPSERMRDMFPTVGAMLAFMLVSHPMMHLGQISTWRRCMGLGPYLKV